VGSRGAAELDYHARIVIALDGYSLSYGVNFTLLLGDPLLSGNFIRKRLLDRGQLAGARIVGQRSSSL